jgi:hypothetical protein
VSNYDIVGGISDRELQEMTTIAQTLHDEVEKWIQTNHLALY